ncbi:MULTISPECIES: cytochrome P450 [unclassified Streptomyces]|uniref:cytochrome P450 n=1 Tax=unclassified Streptomyces TaxID=2593676 RepID=UPI00037F6841|nr:MULTISPECIES: cytochrome P450 [unclassified Streptomyces]MYT34042.1 cytochrome P450 [Streptomyces sp. SID8354]
MSHHPEREPLTELPITRPEGCPFDPPAELAELREEQPLRRMRYPDGHVGWLATGYSVSRAVAGDPRFSSRYELMHAPFPGTEEVTFPPAPVGDLTGIDPPHHTRYRRLLMGKFTVRRMRELTSRVEQITVEHLDAMERQGPPVDLVKAYAHPLPALMICELLGVPYAERELFQEHAMGASSTDGTMEDQYAAMAALQEYVGKLVLAKRARPTDDLLSDLTGTDLTDEELAGVGSFLLGAGLDTTSNMLGLGTFALLTHPDQAAALRADPALADQAVEELMRYLTIAHTGVRTALEDVELDGQLIKAGETVTLAIQAANRDPARFPDPDTLDLRRRATGHLAFGHGIHQCLGQQLARIEMRVAFPALFTRFPTLRLAIPPEEVPLRTDLTMHGVQSLPVTWDAA